MAADGQALLRGKRPIEHGEAGLKMKGRLYAGMARGARRCVFFTAQLNAQNRTPLRGGGKRRAVWS